jgi:hypothetical protein
MAEEAAAGVVATPGVVAAAAVELGRLGGFGGVVGGMGTLRIVSAAEEVEAAGALRFWGRLRKVAAGGVGPGLGIRLGIRALGEIVALVGGRRGAPGLLRTGVGGKGSSGVGM